MPSTLRRDRSRRLIRDQNRRHGALALKSSGLPSHCPPRATRPAIHSRLADGPIPENFDGQAAPKRESDGTIAV